MFDRICGAGHGRMRPRATGLAPAHDARRLHLSAGLYGDSERKGYAFPVFSFECREPVGRIPQQWRAVVCKNHHSRIKNLSSGAGECHQPAHPRTILRCQRASQGATLQSQNSALEANSLRHRRLLVTGVIRAIRARKPSHAKSSELPPEPATAPPLRACGASPPPRVEFALLGKTALLKAECHA